MIHLAQDEWLKYVTIPSADVDISAPRVAVTKFFRV